ncbi:MAG TPA: trypsin-like peptidase domain-containing protein [Dermatophilaceae bacterium]|nr:trypsin-like peptidase domain-containing protein [Dermatophilaceae bacterium]
MTPPQPTAPPRVRRRWLELTAVGVAGAVLASGCTSLSLGDSTQSPSSTVSSSSAGGSAPARPVVQANPVAPDWAATAAAVAPSVVAITISDGPRGVGQGSGVIIDDQGHIVTNHHVVKAGGLSQPTIAVTLDDRRTFEATITGSDPATDLAVLTLRNGPQDLRPIAMGNDDKLRVGDPVMAVGNPLGLAGTVTTGIVSALNRPVSAGNVETSSPPTEPVVTNAVQTSAAINPGNSGGALVDASGQLVGINSSIASTSGSGGNIGIGFAIPVNEARSVAGQLIKNGTVKHAYLGVVPMDGTVQDGAAKRAAALIREVRPGTPGAKAGLKPQDAVVAVDGEPVDGQLSLIAQIREREVNEQVTLTVVRDGQRREVKVTLAERPTTG